MKKNQHKQQTKKQTPKVIYHKSPLAVSGFTPCNTCHFFMFETRNTFPKITTTTPLDIPNNLWCSTYRSACEGLCCKYNRCIDYPFCHAWSTTQRHGKCVQNTHTWKSRLKCINYTKMNTCNSVLLFTTQAHLIWFYTATLPSSKQFIKFLP